MDSGDNHSHTGRELVLSPHLDQLLNEECRLLENIQGVPDHGGLILPTASSPGTGNIVIRGRPGTGKTTLALQIATEAARRNDGIFAAYLSMEESAPLLYEKALDFDWWPYVCPVCRLPKDPEPYPRLSELADNLEAVLDLPAMCRRTGTGKDDTEAGTGEDCGKCQQQSYCMNRRKASLRCTGVEYTLYPGKVIIPSLEPAVFREDGEVGDDELFWKRYKQLDDLLSAAQELREVKKIASKEQVGRLLKLNFAWHHIKESAAFALPHSHWISPIEKLKADWEAGIIKTFIPEECNSLVRRLRQKVAWKSSSDELSLDDMVLIWCILAGNEWIEHQSDSLLSKIMAQKKRHQKNLAVVCIDSLNVLGGRKLTRSHLAALFDLFKRKKMIGVFILEDHERGTFAGDTPIEGDTADFLADMVIELTAGHEDGYFVRHFQILKSRYQHSVLGRHPFKTQEKYPTQEIGDVLTREERVEVLVGMLRCYLPIDNIGTWRERMQDCAIRAERYRRRGPVTGVKIFPSLHYLVREAQGEKGRNWAVGEKNLNEEHKDGKTMVHL